MVVASSIKIEMDGIRGNEAMISSSNIFFELGNLGHLGVRGSPSFF